MQIRRFWLRAPACLRRKQAKRPARRRGGRDAMPLLLSAVLGIGLALLFIHTLDARIRPLVAGLAEQRVNNAITSVINSAVGELLTAQTIAYDDMITLQKDATGRITALTSNTTEMNRLRVKLLSAISCKADSLDSGALGIPLGNLTGLSLFSGRGPKITVRVVSSGAVDAAFRNVFTTAGINQTLHRVMLDASVTVRIFIPGGTLEKTIDTQVPVAETIIVGQVPDTYLQFSPGSGAE